MSEASTQGSGQMTVIGAEAEFRGQLTCRGPARILGSFEGEIASEGEVQIGEGAVCRATIQAARIVVDGALEGDLTASDRVQLGARAQVRGDLIAGALSVSEGASFCGHCTVGPEIAAQPTGAAPERRAKVETRSAKPASATPAAAKPKVVTTPAAGAQRNDSLAMATAELENDPEWRSLSQA